VLRHVLCQGDKDSQREREIEREEQAFSRGMGTESKWGLFDYFRTDTSEGA
jgi:hypothetical protein